MAVMKKKDLEALRRDDPKENNWEVEEKADSVQDALPRDAGGQSPAGTVPEVEGGDSPVKGQSPDVALKQQDFGGIRFEALKPIEKVEAYADGESLLGLPVALLNIAKTKVDPEITAGNPIWHWSISDDHCVFIFRNGQKVRVEL
jgi:hypothetical protein